MTAGDQLRAAGILGVGKCLPDKVVTNRDIVDMGLETSHEWIVERTGIEARRIADETLSTSDLAYGAAKSALHDARVSPQDIDLIIVSTTTPDYPLFPSVACLLQERLGIPHVGAFDLSAACSGFNYALTVGSQFIRTGAAKKVLVVSADCLSKYVDWSDRSICILFGDGAGAVVLGETEKGYGVLTSSLHSDGSQADILIVREGGARTPITEAVLKRHSHYIYMDGRSVFKVAVNTVVPAVLAELEKLNLTAEDIDLFIPHQANLRIIEHTRQKLGLREDQVMVTIRKYGNTSAASIPIALCEAKEEGRLKDGDIIATIGFGAGFTWGASVIRWKA